MKKIINKILYSILVWGKPIIKKKVQSSLKPKLEKQLLFYKTAKKNIKEIMIIVDEFCDNYL